VQYLAAYPLLIVQAGFISALGMEITVPDRGAQMHELPFKSGLNN